MTSTPQVAPHVSLHFFITCFLPHLPLLNFRTHLLSTSWFTHGSTWKIGAKGGGLGFGGLAGGAGGGLGFGGFGDGEGGGDGGEGDIGGDGIAGGMGGEAGAS